MNRARARRVRSFAMEYPPDPNHRARQIRGVLRIIGLVLLPGFFPACTSMYLHRAATEAGVRGHLKDTSAIVGTFENLSATRFGPNYMRLWSLLQGTNGPWAASAVAGSDYSDEVRIAAAGPGFLEIALLSSQGKVRQTVRMPYSIHGNHLQLWHISDFKWLPLGYSRASYDLALTGTGTGSGSSSGDLVVLSRYEVQGIVMLIGNAGDSGTIEFRFPRRPMPDGRAQPATR